MHSELLSALEPSHEDLRPISTAEFRAHVALVAMMVAAYVSFMLVVVR